jgi:hypothetical protein
VERLASALWGDVDGMKVKSASVGKGMIINGMLMNEVLDLVKITPDFKVSRKDPLLYLHRKLAEGDIYFITNQSDNIIAVNPEFRVSGKSPELWDPISGSIRDLPDYAQNNGMTFVPLKLEAYESAFIIFRKSSKNQNRDNVSVNFPEPVAITEISDPWSVVFNSAGGGPKQPVVFKTLTDWTSNSNDSIKYFSGTALYRSKFILEQSYGGKKVYVDLGPVNGMAKVKINGNIAGGLWTAPWKAEISALIKTGENSIEVEIVNTWENRLIGDSKLPENKRMTWCLVNPFTPDSPLAPSGMTGPVKIFYCEN